VYLGSIMQTVRNVHNDRSSSDSIPKLTLLVSLLISR
jgi:hypothetical protein